MKKQVLIATNNNGKYKEISDLLQSYGIETVSPRELGIDLDVEENGSTLEENASIKALAYKKFAPDYPVIADDTGLEIYVLGNEPGIYVRRWKDRKTHMGDEEVLEYCLERMSGVPREKRGGRFHTVVALAAPNGSVEFFHGTTEGTILEKPEPFRIPNLPFDCLFFVDSLGLILGDAKKVLENGKNELTHRNKAVLQTVARLKELTR